MGRRKWELKKNEGIGKYGATIEEYEYDNAPGQLFYRSRILGSHIPMDTNYHKSLAAAKAYIKSEIGLRGGARFSWIEVTHKEEV